MLLLKENKIVDYCLEILNYDLHVSPFTVASSGSFKHRKWKLKYIKCCAYRVTKVNKMLCHNNGFCHIKMKVKIKFNNELPVSFTFTLSVKHYFPEVWRQPLLSIHLDYSLQACTVRWCWFTLCIYCWLWSISIFQSLTDEFRVNYCKLWTSLIKADMEGIKKYSLAMNAGDMYPLFACMLTARSWKAISSGIDKQKYTKSEVSFINKNKKIYQQNLSSIKA